MGLYIRGGVWYARWNEGGRLKRRSLGTGDRAEAELAFRREAGRPLRRRTKMQRRRIARATFDAQHGEPKTIGDAFERWGHYLQHHSHMRKGSIEAYQVTVRRLRDRWGALAIDALRDEHLDEWCAERNANGLARATLQAERQVLRSAMKFFVRKGWMARALDIEPVKKPNKQVPRPISEEEIKKVFRALRESTYPQVRALRTFVLLQLHAGLRREEARFLTWADIDMDGRELHVTAKPDEGFYPKDAEERAIPINDTLAELLERVRTEHPGARYVALSERFTQWSLGVSRWMRQLFNDAGIGTGHGTSHRFRHAFATTLLRAGVDLATLRDLMGHSSVETTSRYLGASPKRQAAVAALALLPRPEE